MLKLPLILIVMGAVLLLLGLFYFGWVLLRNRR